MKKTQFIFRGYLVMSFFIVLILGLFFYLYYLQVVEHPLFYKRARNQHYLTLQTEMERGMIFDCQGKPLAVSLEVDSIYAEPKKIKDAVSGAQKLKGLIKKDYHWIKKQLEKDCYFVWLARKVEPECSAVLRDLNLEGIGILKEYRRFYPQGNLAAHLLGFVGMDNHGLEGLEKHYENVLCPPHHKSVVERDALGQRINLGEGQFFSRKPFNLVLTIDETIQHIAEKELDRAFRETSAKAAQLIVMRPRTGEILALVNRPTFDPNRFTRYMPFNWRNRTVTDSYEPGSSFKAISAAAVLEEKTVAPEDKFFCENGSFRFCRRIIHDHEPKGWLSFREIVEVSSNIGMTKAALLMGKKKLSKRIRQFGFGESTGVDMPGEVKGILRPVNQWTKSSISALSFGQEISVTSLQLVNAVSAIANGGLMMQPYVVKEIRDKQGKAIKKFKPHIKKRVISSHTARTLTEMLRGAVASGTGRLAQVPGYRVAGKTGTAQKFDSKLGKYSRDKFVVSFVGFAPAENPAVAVLVMVDEPAGIAWGGTVAAPVFSRVVGKSLGYLQISPSEGKKKRNSSKSGGRRLKVQSSADGSGDLLVTGRIMPDLKGQTIRESLEKSALFDLDVKIKGSGFLYSQRPAPGEKVNPGESCLLKFMPAYR